MGEDKTASNSTYTNVKGWCPCILLLAKRKQFDPAIGLNGHLRDAFETVPYLRIYMSEIQF